MEKVFCIFEDSILVLESRADKHGNLLYFVSYEGNDGKDECFAFSKMSSALDFIQTNFK